jgi:hypothetical protein
LKYNSLELHWLQKKSKDLFYPNLLFVSELKSAGGYFLHPRKSEVWIGNRVYDLTKGMIIVTEIWDDKDIPNTIAHEWRHFLQYHKFGPIKGTQFNNKVPYPTAIKSFFQNPFERDALLYSHKVAPSSTSDYWMEIINENDK